jgi:hypothetical protein
VPDTTDPPRRGNGIWILVILIVLGLLPFFLSVFVARTARRKALDDPAARKLLTDDEPNRVTGR